MVRRHVCGGRTFIAVALMALVIAACSYETQQIEAELPDNALSSRIYAADGSLLTVLQAEENRDNVTYEEMPDHLVDAIVAIEDERFWQHKGVDVRAVMRAIRTNASAGEIEQGGSTITQQLVKNALLNSDQTLNRKIQEALLAYQVEQDYSKEAVLELYLNTIYFGRGAYGVEAASQRFFGTAVTDIDISEAAVLAGVVRAPSTYDSQADTVRVTERRDIVLTKMRSLGQISQDEYDSAVATPVVFVEEFTEAERFAGAHFVEEVKSLILDDPRFGETPEARRQMLFAGGVRIHTTLDPVLQAKAEEAVASVVPDPTIDPDAALVSIEPFTGEVRAMVGGRDFFGDSAYAKVNLAMGAGRQAGSSFKPLVLAAALQSGIDINKAYPAPKTMTFEFDRGDPWTVSNYGGSGQPSATLADSTIRSLNTAYAQLVLDVGPRQAADMATNLGVRSPIRALPAIVLGTENVTALDMSAAYATFANRGLSVEPTLIREILADDGTVIYEANPERTSVLDRSVADQMNWVLSEVVERGTGTTAQLADRPAAGKTGTAQEWRDAWFVGYTPQLSTSVWVGFPTGQISMQPPTTPIKVTGGSYPAQIWRTFMESALAEDAVVEFATPPSSTTTIPLRSLAPDAANRGRVPAMVGTPVWWARAQLANRGIQFTVDWVDSDVWLPGTVFFQNTTSGLLLPPEGVVTIRASSSLSTGTREARVPETTTTTAPPPDVSSTTAVSGNTPTPAPADSSGTSTVTATTVPSSATTATTAEREPRVPDLTGIAWGPGQVTLIELGLSVTVVRERAPEGLDSRPNVIWRQAPPPGSLVSAAGNETTIWVNPE